MFKVLQLVIDWVTSFQLLIFCYHINISRVFVGGISSTTTEAELHQLFSAFGNVKQTKIIQVKYVPRSNQSLYMKCNIATRYVTTFCQGNNLPKGCLKQVLVISGQKRALFHNHGFISWNGPKNNLKPAIFFFGSIAWSSRAQLYWQYLLWNYCSRKNTAIIKWNICE